MSDEPTLRPPVDEIVEACDEIHRYATQIELATRRIVTPEDWRDALGFIDGASLHLYEMRKRYLKQAREYAEMRRATTHEG